MSLTEWTVARQACELRSQQSDYLSESFPPIVAFKENGAIVHYSPKETESRRLEGAGSLLLDLGTHYWHGTTDMTRTLYILGEPNLSFCRDYTLVLKGLIALATASFPTGTRGCQLDVLARQFLWKEGLHYLHGTGHGVGHCLCVHEGPQSIRMNENPIPLEPGMILTDEPGVYKPTEYGIRLENMLLVKEEQTTAFGSFLSFETLTLIPFQRACLLKRLLKEEEINGSMHTIKRYSTDWRPF
jgi:Xaa-Pro aminopeptidase